MIAVVKTARGPGNVETSDMPEPSPSPHQVKLQVGACGICGTDLHVYHDTFRNFPPVILGHEFVGRVVEEGAAVRGQVDRAARYAVLGATAVTCGRCRWCRSGAFMFCPDRRGMGHGVNGAFTRYACVRPDQLFRLDDNLPEEEGALVEPLAAAVHAVCEITDVQKESLDELVRAETGSVAVDVAFEVAGAAASARACLEAVRPLGSYTQVDHFGEDITVPFDRIGFRQLRVLGSVDYTVATWTRTMRLLAEGLKPTRIVTHRFPLVNWRQGFNLFERKEAVKVLLQP